MAKEFTKADGTKLTITACRKCPALMCKKTQPGASSKMVCTKQNNAEVNRNIGLVDSGCPLPNKA